MKLHKDIAQQFKISSQLVGRLVKEFARHPDFVESQRNKEMLDFRKKDAIEIATKSMLQINRPIVSLGQVQSAVEDQAGLEVPKKMVSAVLRKDLCMGYRLARTVPVQGNLERCLVLR